MTAPSGDSRWDPRRRAREAALHMLYEMEVGGLTATEAAQIQPLVGDEDAVVVTEPAAEGFAQRLASGAWDARAELDGIIGEASTNWRVERLTILDRIVLRLAVREWLAEPATPPRVVLSEAIELARRYSGDEAARFVNGVLDGAFRRLKADGRIVE